MTDSEKNTDPRGNFEKQKRTEEHAVDRKAETGENNDIKIEDKDYAEQIRHTVERSLKPIKIYPGNMKNKIKTIGSNALLLVVVLPSFLAILMPFMEYRDLSPLKMASESTQMIVLCWIIKKTMQWPWCWQTEILDVRRQMMMDSESERLSIEEKGRLVHKLGNYEKYAIFMCIVVAQLGAGLMVWYREFVDIEEPRRKLVFHNFNVSLYLFYSWCRILLIVGWRYRENTRAKTIQEIARRNKALQATKKEEKGEPDASGRVGRRKHDKFRSFFNPHLKSQEIETKHTPPHPDDPSNSRVEYCHIVEHMLRQRDEMEKLAFSIKKLERKLSSADPSKHRKAIEYTSQFPRIDYPAKGMALNDILPKSVSTNNENLIAKKSNNVISYINSRDRPSSNEIKSSSTLSQSIVKESLFEPTFGSNFLWQESSSPYLASLDEGSTREYRRPLKGTLSPNSIHSSGVYPVTLQNTHNIQQEIDNDSDMKKGSDKNIIDLFKVLFKLLMTLIFKGSFINFVRKPTLLKQVFYIELYPIIRQSFTSTQGVIIKKSKKLEWTWKKLSESTLWQSCKIVTRVYINSIKIMLDLWVLIFINIPYNFLRFFSALLFFIPKTYTPLFSFPIFHPIQKRK